MRDISIDVSRLLGRFLKGRLATGVDRVSLEYVRHYGAGARAVLRLGGHSMVLGRPASQRLFEALLAPSAELRRSVPGLLARASLAPARAQAPGAFLFNTGHSGLEQAGYAQRLRRQRMRPLFMVHDLIPITHYEYCRPGEYDKHVTRMNNMLGVASGIIANSQATLDELTSYARRSGLAMPPAVAALLAPAELPPPAPRPPLAGPYFVMLGTIEPRKNHWLILQLWRRLVERYGSAAPRLVLIGQRGWECENVADLLERCGALRGMVTELGACADAELATYLQHARALLFPSFAEGYGMPLAEALARGVPVIASDLPAFREIAAAIPEYLDPLDGMGWLAQILAYAGPESAPRQAQLERLRGYAAPTWGAHFRQVDALLEHLA